MTELSSRTDDRGRWLQIADGGRVVLSAHQAEVESPATIFWNGNGFIEVLDWFFFSSLPTSIVAQNAVIFTPAGKVRLDRVSQDELRSKVPGDAQFLRLEGLSVLPDGPPLQLDLTFIVWSRLTQRALGRLGVYAEPSEFDHMHGNLVTLVAETLPFKMGRDTVSEWLRLMARSLSVVGEPA